MAKVQNTIKTQVGPLKYCFIKGEGRNQAMQGQPEKYMYVASIETEKGSDLYKDIKAQIDATWKEYAEANNVKGGPAKNKYGEPMLGIKTVYVDSETEEDEYGTPLKVATNKVLITFKTNVKWSDGKQNMVKVLKGSGADITTAFHAAPFSIGEGSTGIIHGVAAGNDAGGNHKVTLYLSGIQLQKLVKYSGSDIEAAEMDDYDDIEFEDGMEAIPETQAAGAKPNL
jgi:hypothetical protein